MTKLTKQQVLENELAELNRVGEQPFGAILKDHLVAFDLSVLDTELEPLTKPEPDSYPARERGRSS